MGVSLANKNTTRILEDKKCVSVLDMERAVLRICLHLCGCNLRSGMLSRKRDLGEGSYKVFKNYRKDLTYYCEREGNWGGLM